MSEESEFLRTASLITAAALRDDPETIRALFRRLPPEHAPAVAEGAILAMVGIIQAFVPPTDIQNMIRAAQGLAQESAGVQP